MADLRLSILLVLVAYTCQTVATGYLLYCSPPATPQYGSFHPVKDHYFIGWKISFSCGDGYELSGYSYSQCVFDWKTRSAVWKFPAPVCKRIQCPELTAPENGKVRVGGRNPGDRADYSCNDGFQLVGVAWRKCQTNGEWMGKAPICERIQCPELTAPENGKVHVGGRYPGNIADYSCNDGFELVGVAWRKCLDNGEWSRKAPTCKDILCPVLRAPRNGKVHVGGRNPGATADYSCNDGFELVGAAWRKCLDNGEWSGKAPTCRKIQCPRLKAPENGKVRVGGRDPGDIADYFCNDGFQLVGVAWRKCLGNGEWSGEAPICKRVGCGDPPKPLYGFVKFSDTTPGSKAVYGCLSGYFLVGDSVRYCRYDGNWSGSTPACRRFYHDKDDDDSSHSSST